MTDRPLSILITDAHSGGGGQVRYVLNLARELTRLGHSVTLGCRPNSVLADEGRATGCEVCDRLALRGGLRPRAWRTDIAFVAGFLRAHRPDVVHVSGSQDHWTCAAANRLRGRPAALVRTRHNTYAVGRGVANRLLNRVWTDRQIVVCRLVRDDLAAHPAFDASRLTTIHNGVDAELFRPDPAVRARVRADFGYAEDHVVVGIAARLVPAKGHTYLFDAVQRISDPRLRVLTLGTGPLESALREETRARGIGDRVLFAGFRDDMAACVQAIDIGVQPSVDCDTSSFSLKEQMACEKPVIASDYGGLPEIVDDGVEGLVVAAGDARALERALRSLLADAELRVRMGKAGRARVLREFTVEVFAQRTVAAYREAIAWHQSRRQGGAPQGTG